MNRLVDKSMRIYAQEGPRRLAEQSVRFLYRCAWWELSRLRGGMPTTITVDDTSATFRPEKYTEYVTLNYIKDYERALIEDLIVELNSDDVFWDVGANIGVHSCLAAQRLQDGSTVAFEPYGPNAERLRQNISLNDLENVAVVEKALSNSVGVERFSQPEREDPGNQWPAIVPASTSRSSSLANASIREVEAETGDHLVHRGGLPQPNVVKIDVEGAAPLVIEGMEKTLRDRDCHTVYCEVHLPIDREGARPSSSDFESKKRSVMEFLEDLGFRTQILYRRPEDFFVKASSDGDSGR